jgi:hypothetical protein
MKSPNQYEMLMSHKTFIPFLLIFGFILTLTGCKKSPLDEPYSQVIGQYEWYYTSYREYALGDLKYKYPNESMTAQLQFEKNRIIRFYINDGEIASGTFNVLDELETENGFEMDIKIKIKEGELDIDHDISLSMHNQDTLFFKSFPFESYEKLDAHNSSNFFVRD